MSEYFFLFDKQGKQKTYTTNDIKGLEDLGKWVEFNGEFNPEEDLARLVDGVVVVDKGANTALQALSRQKRLAIKKLLADFNASKKITIQNGKTLVIAHDTPERDYFLGFIEIVSNLKTIDDIVFEYEQETDVGGLGFRILPEIAAYIFKDLFIASLTNGTKVNARKRNKIFIYKNALEQINKAATQSELDDVTWTFLNPQGIVIDVNAKANEMLADPGVSDLAKTAINAAKDTITGEIHLVKTLQELAADS